jgi:hypothetical protein
MFDGGISEVAFSVGDGDGGGVDVGFKDTKKNGRVRRSFSSAAVVHA